MKNLLADFDVKKAIQIVSDEMFDVLLKEADIDEGGVAEIRQSAKAKKRQRSALIHFLEQQESTAILFCYRALRIAMQKVSKCLFSLEVRQILSYLP